MGLPTKGDEKQLLFSNYSPVEAPPSPLSSRPERSAVERSLCGCSVLEMFFDRAAFCYHPNILFSRPEECLGSSSGCSPSGSG